MICEWLDRYFNGKNPLITDLPIALTGTPFQNLVWELVAKIPYGETRTYDDLAINIEKIKGIEKMSRQAVGSAVGKNTIPIVIPCHRVIATDGLGGYSGGDGIETKKKLLIHEGVLKEDGDHSPSSSYYKRRFYKWHLEN